MGEEEMGRLADERDREGRRWDRWGGLQMREILGGLQMREIGRVADGRDGEGGRWERWGGWQMGRWERWGG